jgi:GNAT superfamily N-acetyltransferase
MALSKSDRELGLRPETPEDEPFLVHLFATTRSAEMACLAGAPPAQEAFLRIQYQARKRAYESHYPGAGRSIVIIDGAPAGRMIVDRTGGAICLVDIALLPEHRGHGTGTAVMATLLEEARHAGRSVVLHVLRTNPAAHLYERLGFDRTGGTEMHDAMEWRAAPRPHLP